MTQSPSQPTFHRPLLSTAWSGMLAVLIAVLLVDPLRHAMAGAYTLFFLLHQVVHMAGGEGLGLHTVLDLTHHALGLVACWAAWRWRQAEA